MDIIVAHPHTAIAAACSSTGATHGSSSVDLESVARSTDTGEPSDGSDDVFDDDDEWTTGSFMPIATTSSEDASSEHALEASADCHGVEDHVDDGDDPPRQWAKRWRRSQRRCATWLQHRHECY